MALVQRAVKRLPPSLSTGIGIVRAGRNSVRLQMRRLLERFRNVKRKSDVNEKSMTISYSQQGEDIVLGCFFQGQAGGFYVDVGAYHPVRFSNTNLFYERGWRGINIDPRPGIMAEFAQHRPRDINLEVGVSASGELLNYFIFSEPAVNTCNEFAAKLAQEEGGFTLIGTKQVPTESLAAILDKHLPTQQVIDFLSVDVEGMEKEVLRSNDWSRYRPRAIWTEEISALTLQQALDLSLTRYLADKGYVPIAKTVHSLLFCEETRLGAGYGKLIN